MHLTGVQRDGSRLFIRFLSHLAFYIIIYGRKPEFSNNA